MDIKINKDFEKEYKNELFRGLTTREVLGLATSAAVGMGVVYLLYHYAGVPMSVGVYAGVFAAAPCMFVAFQDIQGMTPLRYLAEIRYAHKTRLLTYEADEIPKRKGAGAWLPMEKPGRKRKRAGFRHRSKKTDRQKDGRNRY